MFSFRPEGSVARNPAECCGRGGFRAAASCGAGRGREAVWPGAPPPEAAPAREDAQGIAGAHWGYWQKSSSFIFSQSLTSEKHSSYFHLTIS